MSASDPAPTLRFWDLLLWRWDPESVDRLLFIPGGLSYRISTVCAVLRTRCAAAASTQPPRLLAQSKPRQVASRGTAHAPPAPPHRLPPLGKEKTGCLLSLCPQIPMTLLPGFPVWAQHRSHISKSLSQAPPTPIRGDPIKEGPQQEDVWKLSMTPRCRCS